MRRALLGVLLLVVTLPVLLFVEASFGHDGLLCEMGIETGSTSDGCAWRIW